MPPSDTENPRELLAATLDWWREAGVDCAFSDEPQQWLADPAAPEAPGKKAGEPAQRRPVAAQPQAPAAPQAPRIGGDPAQIPQDLEEFARWWLTEPSLDHAPAARRVPPSGRAGAELMVLVPMPEDGDEAVLLAGKAGNLLDAMLAAMGLSRDRIYLAAVLPARDPAPDWLALGESGMRAVLAHHIALAAPQKLLILGSSVVSTLVGNDTANNAQTLRSFNHEGTSVPVRAGKDLEAMLQRPGLKAGLWNSWVEWTGTGQ